MPETSFNDEARYRHLGNYNKRRAAVLALKPILPSPVYQRVGLDRLKLKCEESFATNFYALVQSGYLVEAWITPASTNGGSVKIHQSLKQVLPTGSHWMFRLDRERNQIMVMCKPEYVALCRKALEEVNNGQTNNVLTR